MVKTAEELVKQVAVTIAAPNFATVEMIVQGTAPLVVERFAVKAALEKRMQEGSTAASRGRKRTARDFEKDAENAKHIAEDGGWEGFNASGIRIAAIDACRLVGYKMTLAKLSVFVVADGMSQDDEPIIRIYGQSKSFTKHTRNATGVIDIRSRPMYRDWAARLRIQFDADQFRPQDVINLISRAGLQVGIGAGRPNSKQSAGCGWGTFRVVPSEQEAEVRKRYGIAKA